MEKLPKQENNQSYSVIKESKILPVKGRRGEEAGGRDVKKDFGLGMVGFHF